MRSQGVRSFGLSWICLPGVILLTMGARAETLELPPEISPWTWVGEVWTDGGYLDNLLLSQDARESSAFAQVGAQLGLMRLPLGRFHFQVNVSGQERHFFDGITVDHERSFTASTEMSLDIGRSWQARLEADYLFQDQVLDASIDETDKSSLPIVSHTVEARPAMRRDFYDGWWTDLGLNVVRQNFQQKDLDGYWEGGPRLLAGHRYGRGSEYSAEVGVFDRWYDDRVTSTSSGIAVAGDALRYRATSLTLQWKHNWDEQRHWRTLTRIILERNEDNGSGYFNYDRLSISEQLRYRTKRWEARGQLRVSRYHYTVQARDRLSLRGTLRLEYHLARSLTVHGDYELERSFSDRAIDEYTANTVSAGMGWEF